MLFVFVYLTGVQQMMSCGLTTVTIIGAGTVAYHTGVPQFTPGFAVVHLV
jgi:hypothetical protein